MVDFGLAKLRVPFSAGGDGSTHTAAQTEAGTVLGTVAYMAPEQTRGEEEQDENGTSRGHNCCRSTTSSATSQRRSSPSSITNNGVASIEP